ncbi:MAG TPA: EF-Tu/IF-2/RF-3 family GTPase [Candidatus Glassbacteria bacterium]|nr:EF-Tu/IF-2/RF-3 family GTPase [Candidatus Glassbacteria bacterium]
MGNLVVSILGTKGYADKLGKKGTSTDITLYNLKKGEDTVTFLEPSRYPERLAPLFYSTTLAKKAIVVVDELDSFFGETLVMLQCCGIKKGSFILRNYFKPEKIMPLIKETILENYDFIDDEPSKIREQMLREATQEENSEITNEKETTGSIPIDHAFKVKGVGSVALGIVADGNIKKHDTLRALPNTNTTQIRSIQKHDDEYNIAQKGDRVGLALKNIETKNLDRGTVLTNDPTIKLSKSLKTQAEIIRYWQTPLKSEMIVHIGHWMQFLPARIESITDDKNWRTPILNLKLEKELVHHSGDKAVLTHLEGGKLRIVGTITLP